MGRSYSVTTAYDSLLLCTISNSQQGYPLHITQKQVGIYYHSAVESIFVLCTLHYTTWVLCTTYFVLTYLVGTQQYVVESTQVQQHRQREVSSTYYVLRTTPYWIYHTITSIHANYDVVGLKYLLTPACVPVPTTTYIDRQILLPSTYFCYHLLLP